MSRQRKWNIAIVGAGKVGSVLGKILVENGNTISCVVSRSKVSARKAGRFLRCKNVSDSLSAIPSQTDIVYITTPHSAVQDVATALSQVEQLPFQRLSVCHASGMLTSDVLEPLRRKGATVFSFHPLQTFPRNFEPRAIVERARGIYYGVDGEPVAVRKAKAFASRLEGKVIVIPPELRTLYHAACVVASNHVTTLLWTLELMFDRLRTTERDFFRVFKPIIMATLHNNEMTSPARALSGPIARGGVETVRDHLVALRDHLPALIPYFATMSLETVKLAIAKGSIDSRQADALIHLIHSYQSLLPTLQEKN